MTCQNECGSDEDARYTCCRRCRIMDPWEYASWGSDDDDEDVEEGGGAGDSSSEGGEGSEDGDPDHADLLHAEINFGWEVPTGTRRPVGGSSGSAAAAAAAAPTPASTEPSLETQKPEDVTRF